MKNKTILLASFIAITLLFGFSSQNVFADGSTASQIAGWRSSQYGDNNQWGHDQSDPAYWISVAQQMSSKFPGFTPGGVLLIGEIDGAPGTATSTFLPFPKPSGTYPNVNFGTTDKIEPLLDAYDNAGLGVYLQVESADADIPMLIDLIMTRYQHHPSVIGFGVDAEWYHEVQYPGWGRPLTDTEVIDWAAQVKTIDPDYSLMVKHWDWSYLSNARPDNVLFLTDGQNFGSLSGATNSYVSWIDHFGDAQVGFQTGYPADMSWWSNLNDPASSIMNSVISARPNANIGAIFWVDFSVLAAFPDSETNNLPIANDQSTSTFENTPLPITLTAIDADGDQLTYSKTNPSNGSLSGIAPNLTYDPNSNFSGNDSFTFKANDGIDDSNTATISITVNAINDAPVADPQSLSTDEDTSLQITLSASDGDDDPLTFSVVSSPSNGSLSGTAPNLTYTPNNDFNGNDSFTFQANDGIDDSNIATISITVNAVNDTPVADPQSLSTDENTSLSITLSASDGDNDPLTFSVVSSPSNGSLSGTAPNLTYTPNNDFNGNDSFTTKANDGIDDSNIATISITVNAVNDEPSFTTSNQSVEENIGQVTIPDFTTFNPGATNEAGQTAAYTVSNGNNGLFSSPPTISSEGTLVFEPVTDTNGSAIVTVFVQDNGGTTNGGENASPEQTFSITVNPTGDVYVEEFVVNASGKKRWTGSVTTTVYSGGSPVENANVFGSWSGGASGTDNCMTNENGQCQVSKPTKKDSLTFTIDNITGNNMSYDPIESDSITFDKNENTLGDNLPPITIHVASLEGESASANGPWSNIIMVITVHDHDNLALQPEGVVITGDWSGIVSGNSSCTTDTSGTCSVTKRTKNSGDATFTVTNISGTGFEYGITDDVAFVVVPVS